MGFLGNAIRRGISEGVGKAVGSAVEKAVAPKAAEFADKTAQQLDQAAGTAAQQTAQAAQTQQNAFTGAFANLQRAAQGFADEAARNIKLCPTCGEPTGADQKFCPKCGAKLPEETVAQGAVCPSCGKQNSVGTKFCSDCGTKLPAAVREEQAAQAKDEAVMAQWDELLSAYPKWNCGGTDLSMEQQEENQFTFTPNFFGNHAEAQQAVEQYREVLLQNGFTKAGQYPSVEHLYKMINGVCYHVDTEHCFDGDPDLPSIGFDISQPSGGFDYVKPEPKKPASLKDLFKL